MADFPKLYRKRLIPQEIIYLKDDVILHLSDELIVTKWNTIRPRHDFSHGISSHFVDKNFKISKIYDKDHAFVYWYCDIIHVTRDLANDSIIIEDLLIDVIIRGDGSIKILDLEEIADAYEAGILSRKLMYVSLRAANDLLNIIYDGKIGKYMDVINQYEKE